MNDPPPATLRLTDPVDRRAFRDIVLAGERIVFGGGRQDDPAAARVLAEATRYLGFYSDEEWEAHELASRCRRLLAHAASLEIARAALDFIAGCALVPDLRYRIDDARYSAKGECMAIVSAAAHVHQGEIERVLLAWGEGDDIRAQAVRPDAFALMARIGTRRSFDCMLAFLGRRETAEYLASPYVPPLLGQLLRWLERHDFAPDLICALNETVARQGWRSDFMAAYHHQLRECARTFALLTGGRLCDRLAPGGVQLWDYWMTYAPDAAVTSG